MGKLAGYRGTIMDQPTKSKDRLSAEEQKLRKLYLKYVQDYVSQ